MIEFSRSCRRYLQIYLVTDFDLVSLDSQRVLTAYFMDFFKYYPFQVTLKTYNICCIGMRRLVITKPFALVTNKYVIVLMILT